jgi:hypothetical protein
MTPRIGYKASAEQFNPRELVEFAVQAEQVGMDTVMVSDHFQPWRHTGGHAPFSMSWLAAVGERPSGPAGAHLHHHRSETSNREIPSQGGVFHAIA